MKLGSKFYPLTMALAAVCLPLRSQAIQPIGTSQHSVSFDFANFNVPIAGVAGGASVVFVGEPLKPLGKLQAVSQG